MRIAILALAFVAANGGAFAQEQRFKGATETDDQLAELYRQADNECSHVNHEDVRTIVGCISRTVYGQALNERNRCLGREGEDKVSMKWHGCEGGSIRFDRVEIPNFK